MTKATPNNSPAVFEEFNIRKHFDKENDKWLFSVIDIVAILTEQQDYQKARKYWNKLSERLTTEGSEAVTNCHQLKMLAQDGKMRLTDVADVETLLRLIQSVPSKKAEPIKLWLARVGYERIQETADPEISINRARKNWLDHGRSPEWIQRRMSGQEIRNKLTDYWGSNDIKEGKEFAILTNVIHREWSDLSVKQHKEIKGLKNQNLRDHMNEAELLFTALAELSTRQIAEADFAKGLEANKRTAKKGGAIAKNARLELEQKTGKKVVDQSNFLENKPDNKNLKTK